MLLLLLIPTPTVADVTSELARCELEAERLLHFVVNSSELAISAKLRLIVGDRLREVSHVCQGRLGRFVDRCILRECSESGHRKDGDCREKS